MWSGFEASVTQHWSPSWKKNIEQPWWRVRRFSTISQNSLQWTSPPSCASSLSSVWSFPHRNDPKWRTKDRKCRKSWYNLLYPLNCNEKTHILIIWSDELAKDRSTCSHLTLSSFICLERSCQDLRSFDPLRFIVVCVKQGDYFMT